MERAKLQIGRVLWALPTALHDAFMADEASMQRESPITVEVNGEVFTAIHAGRSRGRLPRTFAGFRPRSDPFMPRALAQSWISRCLDPLAG